MSSSTWGNNRQHSDICHLFSLIPFHPALIRDHHLSTRQPNPSLQLLDHIVREAVRPSFSLSPVSCLLILLVYSDQRGKVAEFLHHKQRASTVLALAPRHEHLRVGGLLIGGNVAPSDIAQDEPHTCVGRRANAGA